MMECETASFPTTERTELPASETIGALFQPDTLLTEKFFSDRRGQSALEPEKRLMLAVLEDALYSFQDNFSAKHGRRKQLFDDAEKWFFKTSGDWVFSFENISSVLGFDPEYVRKGLMRWREIEISKHHGALCRNEQLRRQI